MALASDGGFSGGSAAQWAQRRRSYRRFVAFVANTIFGDKTTHC